MSVDYALREKGRRLNEVHEVLCEHPIQSEERKTLAPPLFSFPYILNLCVRSINQDVLEIISEVIHTVREG